MEKIDRSIIHIKETMNEIMSDVEAEQKKQEEFKKNMYWSLLTHIMTIHSSTTIVIPH